MFRRIFLVLLAVCLLQTITPHSLVTSLAARENLQESKNADGLLRNRDIILLAKAGVPEEMILAKLKASKNEFEITPDKLRELKSAGLSDAVIVAMVEKAGSGQTAETASEAATKEAKLPDGTKIEIEAPFPISSLHFKPGDEISFRVVDPLIIDGVKVIEQGATATGRVERAKRGGHFGKAGLLTWAMKSVTAIDGAQIPLRVVPLRQRGDSKGAKVATQMIITGALLPFIAPVALLHGFKRGGDAYIPAGKRYEVYVNGEVVVRGRP